jgi:hypothetical protein
MGHPVDTDCVGKDNETKWTVIESGRVCIRKIWEPREQPGPTPHATRNVSEDKVSLALRFLIDDSILRHIKH